MVATISPDPRLQFFANDGSFLVGGKLYTYAAGTTTPLATYTTSTGLIANTNPVILDSRGEASVWLTSSKYKFVLKTAADVEVWTQDQLQGYANADGSNATGTWPISITGNAATATYATVAGSVTPGAAVTSITGAGLYGFTLPGGPITSSGTLTVTPPAPSTAGNVLTSNGTSWVSQAISIPTAVGTTVVRSYTPGSYTWTKPTGLVQVEIEIWGACGSGAASSNSGAAGASGGGGTAYGKKVVAVASLGATETVTVGAGGAGVSASGGTNVAGNAGGTTSFGSHVSITGGGAGAASSASPIAGGAAGTATSAAYSFAGTAGGSAVVNADPADAGPGGTAGGYVIKNSSTTYGSAASGGAASNTGSPVSSGTGSSGLILVTEYY
jgi:hypothetical protein